MTRLLLALALGIVPLQLRAGNIAGDFDYYILALSWSPTWCSLTGDARNARQCDADRDVDFVVHGLWPQYESGWPQDCATQERDPSRRESEAMEDIMGSGGLAWYQWQKHGRCSGLPARGYYGALREAAAQIKIPEVFDGLSKDINLPPLVVEEAFVQANPAVDPDGVTVTCRDGALQEVRICLTRDLEPRSCAPDARRDCAQSKILMEGVR